MKCGLLESGGGGEGRRIRVTNRSSSYAVVKALTLSGIRPSNSPLPMPLASQTCASSLITQRFVLQPTRKPFFTKQPFATLRHCPEWHLSVVKMSKRVTAWMLSLVCFTKHYYGHQIRRDEMGEECSTQCRYEKMRIKFWSEGTTPGRG
jgi:hypothetical protein